MKTNIYLSTLAIFSAFSIEAQVTLTQSNHAPVIGDNNPPPTGRTLFNSIIPTLNITGNGVTWDFTNKLASNTNTLVNVFVDPTTLAGSSIYIAAGCNVALQDSDFYKSSSTKLEYLGDISPDGEIFDLTPNPVTFMQYPFSYGSSFTDVTSGTMTFPGGSFNLTGTINVVADGQGTLILPSNPTIVHNNVLRVKSTSTLLIQGNREFIHCYRNTNDD
ncbi:MAG: hypothetical protein KatS3mg027_1789 [Bacteroidia bacterium]|nr:MAG: hypothetical protein KatS3mg027_1789 [Bacteroidia bacterium]